MQNQQDEQVSDPTSETATIFPTPKKITRTNEHTPKKKKKKREKKRTSFPFHPLKKEKSNQATIQEQPRPRQPSNRARTSREKNHGIQETEARGIYHGIRRGGGSPERGRSGAGGTIWPLAGLPHLPRWLARSPSSAPARNAGEDSEGEREEELRCLL